METESHDIDEPAAFEGKRIFTGPAAYVAKIKRLKSMGYEVIKNIDRNHAGNPHIWTRFIVTKGGIELEKSVRMDPITESWEVR